VFGYSQRAVLSEEMKLAASTHAQFRDKLASTSLDRIKADPESCALPVGGLLPIQIERATLGLFEALTVP
jgi:hypothetical protein